MSKTFKESCWYYTNGYQCKWFSCQFNHNFNQCIEVVSKKTFEFCNQGILCKTKCNKIHNLDLFKSITQYLVNTIEITNKQQFKIDDLIIKNNIQSYQIEELSIINKQQSNKLQDCNNETLELLNCKNKQLLEKNKEIEELKAIKYTLELQHINLIENNKKLTLKNKDLQVTNDTLGLLNSCNKYLQ